MNTSQSLADYLEIWGFEENFAVFRDGTFGFGLELLPLDISCRSDEDKNQLAVSLTQVLNSLPSNINLQFVQDIKSGNNALIEKFLSLTANDATTSATDLAAVRAAEFQKLDLAGFLPKHTLKLFVRLEKESPVDSGNIRSLITLGKKASKTELDFQLAKSKAERLKDSLLSELSSLGLAPRQMSLDEILGLIFAEWNPNRNVPLGSFDPEDVRDSLLFSDLSMDESGFILGSTHHRVISLKTLPDVTYSGMAEMLRDLPFDSRLFLTVHVPDQMKEIETLKTQRRIAYSMVYGKKTGVSDLESEAKLADLEGLLEQMVSSGEKVFHVGLNVLVRGQSEAELDERVREILLSLRQMSGAEGMVETVGSFPIFSQVSIPNAKNLERIKKVKTSNLRDLLPLFGPWTGHTENPSVLFKSRAGSLVALDPFSSGFTNYNQLISGGSGAGKSFLTNLILLQMLKEKPRVFFVDIGGSYKKLCENLGGEYLPLGAASGIAINPFDLLEGETTPSDAKIKFLVGLIELMTKEDGEARLPRLERAEIEDSIIAVYKNEPTPQLSHLALKLSQNENLEIRRIAKILNSWCGNTPFGRLVDAKTNISLSSPVVAFDLKGMESMPDLQAVFLFIITDFVWREVQRSRGEKKFLVFDECWKLLKNDSGLVFIEEVFRTFRKYNASAIAISQDIDDFAKSKIAGAILPNCSVKWLLMQNKGDPTRIKEVLSLNDNEISLVQSLTQKKGIYSETFLIAQSNRSVIVLEATPLEYWIATTDPKDLAEVEKDIGLSPDTPVTEILKRLSQKYPEGMAAHERNKNI